MKVVLGQIRRGAGTGNELCDRDGSGQSERLTPRRGGESVKDPLWGRAVRGSQAQDTAEVFDGPAMSLFEVF